MKFSDCLVTHWLQMTSTFFLIVRICHNHFKCNCLKNKKLLLNCLRHFWNLHQILNNLNKRESSSLINFPNYRLTKTLLDQCLKSHVTQHHSKTILLKISKHLRILHDSTSIIFLITLGKIELQNVSVSNM